ncbi:GTP-binding domain [Caulobacter phage CcrRogue]|uniref:Uncharacterized protein n=1 Tax=Caulobacter phage CcrRogue TaxID=2927986 RepID=K4JSB3_9CAUD|nr:GTP-binding domain [Caulobacter phage CcrRogue]AFU86633.1 hypothetical protein CcrRogue_gp151 [Caulobacter phage CcrRogue]
MTPEAERPFVAVVCGGRVGVVEIAPTLVLSALVSALRWPRDMIWVDGDAVGYDRLCRAWAAKWGFATEVYKVDPALDGEGDDAPKRRNTRMRETSQPDVCVAFPGGPGTRDMWMQCLNAGIRVYSVEFDGDRYTVYQMDRDQPGLKLIEGKLR